MAKPKDAEGYEVAGERFRQHEDKLATLKQALADYKTPDPARNFTHRISGNQVTLYYHVHERGMGDTGKRAMIVAEMVKGMGEYVKVLKRLFKERGGGTLELKEDKKARGYDLQKVSLNDRWSVVYRQTFMVDGLITNPEE